jgi:hypothetical protein
VQQSEGVVETGRRRAGHAVRTLAILALTSLAILAQGCREEEQDRPLLYHKGTYQGQLDQGLDQDQVEALRQRAGEHQI